MVKVNFSAASCAAFAALVVVVAIAPQTHWLARQHAEILSGGWDLPSNGNSLETLQRETQWDLGNPETSLAAAIWEAQKATPKDEPDRRAIVRYARRNPTDVIALANVLMGRGKNDIDADAIWAADQGSAADTQNSYFPAIGGVYRILGGDLAAALPRLEEAARRSVWNDHSKQTGDLLVREAERRYGYIGEQARLDISWGQSLGYLSTMVEAARKVGRDPGNPKMEMALIRIGQQMQREGDTVSEVMIGSGIGRQVLLKNQKMTNVIELDYQTPARKLLQEMGNGPKEAQDLESYIASSVAIQKAAPEWLRATYDPLNELPGWHRLFGPFVLLFGLIYLAVWGFSSRLGITLSDSTLNSIPFLVALPACLGLAADGGSTSLVLAAVYAGLGLAQFAPKIAGFARGLGVVLAVGCLIAAIAVPWLTLIGGAVLLGQAGLLISKLQRLRGPAVALLTGFLAFGLSWIWLTSAVSGFSPLAELTAMVPIIIGLAFVFGPVGQRSGSIVLASVAVLYLWSIGLDLRDDAAVKLQGEIGNNGAKTLRDLARISAVSDGHLSVPTNWPMNDRDRVPSSKM